MLNWHESNGGGVYTVKEGYHFLLKDKTLRNESLIKWIKLCKFPTLPFINFFFLSLLNVKCQMHKLIWEHQHNRVYVVGISLLL